MVCLSFYLLCFLFNKIGEEDLEAKGEKGNGGGSWEARGRDGPCNVYTYEYLYKQFKKVKGHRHKSLSHVTL
jgi:hypothetical protein